MKIKKQLAAIVAALCLASGVCAVCATTSDYVDFLYRYMSLPDHSAQPRAYYEGSADIAVRARHEMPWGTLVPEREFRHFVVPPRVNNETLDRFREVYYNELKERVRGLSMSEAVLEVNHWCHEHVTYRPTDARTSSPLATVCTAYGRCGEESTLLVAALRTVCIPARQVYTPRWAHTDDNHAWVEAWADGAWHFLGACEPEPVLDLGWFNESASRAMLMHTKVFGDYDGPEEVVSRTPCYTEINVTSNYAPTALLNVVVTDSDGHPATGALVEFKVYNYAELYTVASKVADAEGRASLTAGLGDVVVWATLGGATAVAQATVGQSEPLQLRLSRDGVPPMMHFYLTPPRSSGHLPAVSEAQRQANDRRLATEDSIRHARESVMPVEAWRGNYATIEQFLREAPNATMAQCLLDVLTAKDLRDVPLDVLRDNAATVTDTSELNRRYVLCPRVENEWLTPYKAVLRERLAGIASPAALEQWCHQHIALEQSTNPQQLRMTPLGVLAEGKADELGRGIFFVAAARSLGWPARMRDVDGRVQWHDNDGWHDATFGEASDNVPNTAHTQRLALTYDNALPHIVDPKYYIHFTLSRLVDGRLQLLNYPEEATWAGDFAGGVPLEAGTYVLTTGTRMASGRVDVTLQTFVVGDNDLDVPIVLHESRDEASVIGSLNAENLYYDLATGTTRSLLSTTGRGYYVLAIVAPNHEPTNHTLRDIAACNLQFEAWGRPLMVLLTDDDAVARFNFDEYVGMPSTTVWGVDRSGAILAELAEQLHLPSTSLPLYVVCDTFNRVVYVQQGYTIHLGEQLLKILNKL